MSTTAPTISQTPARHVLWHFGHDGGLQPGGFTQQLIVTICAADPDNQALLALGFPEYVAAVQGAQLDLDGIAHLQKIARNEHCLYCGHGEDEVLLLDKQETDGDTICQSCVSDGIASSGEPF